MFPVLNIEGKARPDMSAAPLKVITKIWKRLVHRG
jgi:hypothetical protein